MESAVPGKEVIINIVWGRRWFIPEIALPSDLVLAVDGTFVSEERSGNSWFS